MTDLLAPLVVAIAGFFLLMGLVALAAPQRVGAINGDAAPTLEGRNEIRAVYGGFGVLMSATLWWARAEPAYRPGVFLTVGLALAGMALGRLVSAAIERPRSLYPSWFFFALESAMAAVLCAAAQP